MVYARGQLRDAMDKYAALRAQIQTAQIDLETAQAAFKYRYTVVTPAHLPKTPDGAERSPGHACRPRRRDALRLLARGPSGPPQGTAIERWQVERLLGRPILGDITLPDDASHEATRNEGVRSTSAGAGCSWGSPWPAILAGDGDVHRRSRPALILGALCRRVDAAAPVASSRHDVSGAHAREPERTARVRAMEVALLRGRCSSARAPQRHVPPQGPRLFGDWTSSVCPVRRRRLPALTGSRIDGPNQRDAAGPSARSPR